ncbi:MAG: Ig-like domain-containing protein, partial [Chloroflexi bacterium]|nr:Ig-like domain-containing protein [Chloroflexota bacterium]
MMAATRRHVGRNRRRQLWLAVALVAALVVGGAAGGLIGLRTTATPVSAAPAAVIGWEPGVTRGVPLAGPLTVFFSRGMDRASVQRAWHLSPAAAGTFSWTDTSVSFRPARPLRAGSYYRLAIGPAARDDQHRPLQNPLAVSFTTGDALRVESTTPAAGTQAVPMNGLVAVTFNHPMVALTGLDTATPDPQGWQVTISPRTPGHGSWLGTSTWVFHPDAGLVPSSTYTVVLRGSARDAWGEPLGHDLRWSFRTATPAVVDRTPGNGTGDANPGGEIAVTFNQPMDPASTSGAFTLRGSGAPVAGAISWRSDTLVFRPAAPLDPAMTYTAAVAARARSANGLASLGRPVSWRFHVAPPPRVLSSVPAAGAAAASPYVELHFSAPMDQASLDRHLKIDPSPGGMSTYLSGPNGPGSSIYSINGQFQPSTSYTITVAAGARDTFGRVLAAPYTLRFTTAPISPAVSLYGTAGAGPGIAFSAGRVVNAPIQLVNVPSVRYTLVRTSLTAAGLSSTYGSPLTIPRGTTVRDWSAQSPSPLNKLQNLGVPLADADGTPLAPGLYWLGARSPSSRNPTPASSELVVASNASVTLKTSASQALVWATSARSGDPLAGATIRLVDSNGKVIASGTSGANGVYVAPLSGNQSVQTALLDDGAHFGMATSGWQPYVPTSYSPVDANGRYVPPPNGSYVYTDRPIYRPGQTVHFR